MSFLVIFVLEKGKLVIISLESYRKAKRGQEIRLINKLHK